MRLNRFKRTETMPVDLHDQEAIVLERENSREVPIRLDTENNEE